MVPSLNASVRATAQRTEALRREAHRERLLRAVRVPLQAPPPLRSQMPQKRLTVVKEAA